MRLCYMCKGKIDYDTRWSRCRACDKKYQMKRRQNKPRECIKCGIEKPTSEFYKRQNGRYEGCCKQCKHKMQRDNYHRRRAEADVLTAHVVACKHCKYQEICRVLVMEFGVDPYCFVSSQDHEIFVEYAEARARS